MKFNDNTIRFLVCDFRNQDDWKGSDEENLIFKGEKIAQGYIHIFEDEELPAFAVFAEDSLLGDWFVCRNVLENWIKTGVNEDFTDGHNRFYNSIELYRALILEMDSTMPAAEKLLDGDSFKKYSVKFKYLGIQEVIEE